MSRLVRIAIVVVWLGLMAALLRDRWTAAPAPEPLPAAPATLHTGDEWLNVFHGDQKIGYVRHHAAAEDGGHRFEEQSLLRLTFMNEPQTVRTIISGRTDATYALQQFTFELSSGVGTLRVRGTVAESGLHLTMATGAEESTQTIALTGPIYLPTTLRSFVASNDLQAGREFAVEVFDPSVMKNDTIRVTVERREAVPGEPTDRQAWRIQEEFHGIRTTAWIDDTGAVVREEGPLGLTLRRTNERDAVYEGWASDTALDLVQTVAVPVTRAIDHPRDTTMLRLRVRGIDLDQVPSDARQRRAGDTFTITREDLGAVRTYSLPYDGAEHRDDLAATPLLQIEHPRVQAAAAEATAGERDALQAVRRLLGWMNGYMRQAPTVSIPNALQVLDQRQGDCNEHSVLFAALARAVGLPARVVAGVVYLDGAFYYHAWNEVWLGDWVAVDPAFNQFPADPTHLKFVQGGPEEQFEILHVIGRLGIDVLATG
jgi:transglutaminase-like putative cysteine protease